MALQKSHTFRGLAAVNAYHRITGITISRARNQTLVEVSAYANAEAATADEEPLSCTVVLTGYHSGVSVAAAYAHLKTLPEYADAVDV